MKSYKEHVSFGELCIIVKFLAVNIGVIESIRSFLLLAKGIHRVK